MTNTKGPRNDSETPKCCGLLTASMTDDEYTVVHGLSNDDGDHQHPKKWEYYLSQSNLSSLHSNWSDADDECNHIQEQPPIYTCNMKLISLVL